MVAFFSRFQRLRWECSHDAPASNIMKNYVGASGMGYHSGEWEPEKDKIIAIILTGANHDGGVGVKKIKQSGGYIIVQTPESAEADTMPKAAIAATNVDKVLPLEQIGPFLLQLVNSSIKKHFGKYNRHRTNRFSNS
ncbi:chemotaxis protein CheB [Thiotrichales bacterium HSG1]|nr:chemotaxis protein CheB [Thiotrichales bacterium HSG1]